MVETNTQSHLGEEFASTNQLARETFIGSQKPYLENDTLLIAQVEKPYCPRTQRQVAPVNILHFQNDLYVELGPACVLRSGESRQLAQESTVQFCYLSKVQESFHHKLIPRRW